MATAIDPAANRNLARRTRVLILSRTIPFDPRRRTTVHKTGKSEASPEMMAVSGTLSGKVMDP
jgi:hypothetical protein